MSQWFSTQRATFRAMSEAHSALIESHALDGTPFLMRLRHSRCLSILAFVRLERGVYARRQVWRCRDLYYRITDRLLGGGRYDKFVNTCEQRYKQALANLEENTRKLQEADGQLFNLRVLEQSFKNPNFVVTNRPHQDRH